MFFSIIFGAGADGVAGAVFRDTQYEKLGFHMIEVIDGCVISKVFSNRWKKFFKPASDHHH